MTEITRFFPDDLDKSLIQELEIDARKSSITLGAKLGISPPTVLRRIKRLRDAGAFVFVALIDPAALGYKTRALMGIKVQAGKVAATVDALRACRNIQSINLTCGRYDIIVPTFFRNNDDIVRFIRQELGRMDIESVETFVILQQIKKNASRQISNDPGIKNDHHNHSLDDLDLKLIKDLELQPGGSITDLSQKFGVSRPTIKTRLDTLQAKGILRTVTVVDPRVFGLNVSTLIFVKVRPEKIDHVVGALSQDKRVLELGIMSGRLDMNLWVVFRDSDEMSEFVRNTLGGIPGVTECEVHIQAGLPQQPSTSVIQHLS